MYTLLKYGNTNTYLIGSLLIDTDMAGTMPALFRELKQKGIPRSGIRYVMATHYHPDHMGLIGELMQSGVKWLLLEHQKQHVHDSDAIYARDQRLPFAPLDESRAILIKAEDSRAFLSSIGIDGEIIRTASHSPDGAALVLNDGNAFVGDLEPREYLAGYTENEKLKTDWENLLRLGADKIHYGHIQVKNSDQ